MKKLLKWVYGKVPLKKEMCRALKTVWTPPQSIYRHLHFTGAFTVPVQGGGFRINHHGYEVENEIFWRGLQGGWEPVSMTLWIELCKASRFILDVGANTGIYALPAKAVNPLAEVSAFEPVERIFDKLVANSELNGYDIRCVKAAASNFDGKATIYETVSEHLYSVTVNRNLNSNMPTVPVEVKTTRLDTFLGSLPGAPRIDLMKLDVETHEPEVLQGLGNCLDRCRPAMLIEVLSDEAGERIEHLLKGMDYLYFNIDEVNAPERQPHLTKSKHFNFLVCGERQARRLSLL